MEREMGKEMKRESKREQKWEIELRQTHAKI